MNKHYSTLHPVVQKRPLEPLYPAAQLRELDRLAIETAGIPGYTLMTRAAAAAWQALQARWPAARDVLVLCGGGNNGGDGLVLARLALQSGCRVRVVLAADPDRLRDAAATARDDWLAAGGEIESPGAMAGADTDVIVDALLGTGFAGPVSSQWRDLILAANAAPAPVVAIDVPSGLAADSGDAGDCAIRAALTVTFIGRKPGLYTGEGPACCGDIVFDDLGVPADIYPAVTPGAWLDRGAQVNPFATARCRTAHKGHYGHVLVVGGDHGMNGAVRLAGEAALRSGAGLVSIATRKAHAAMLAAVCPELMCHGVESVDELQPLLARASVVVAGPGLGRAAWAQALLSTLLESTRPLVLDADALNLLAGETLPRGNWILTPHPGEAARLLGITIAAVQADRLAAARSLQSRWGGVIILKGAGTVICSGESENRVCSSGNPGMATAGTGDVLSGITGALLAQHVSLPEAAAAAVCLHGAAGDVAAMAASERGLRARDLIAALPGLLRD